jgi:hypothetical protein
MSCKCVKRHTPKAVAFQVHHVVPKAWGGKDVPSNLETLCGTTHDNVHRLLNIFVKQRGFIESKQLRQFPKYTILLAHRAIVGVGGIIPRIYTTPESGAEDAEIDNSSAGRDS